MLALGSLLSAACGDSAGGSSAEGGAGNGAASGSESDGAGCTSLCTAASFDTGSEMDFGGGVVECVCSGAGEGLAQTACGTYCDGFGVTAKHALLSMQALPNDKCVCDGTQAGGANSAGNGSAGSASSDGGASGGDSTGGDSAGGMLDANGFPSLPTSPLPGSTGVIVVSVANSTSAHLAAGVYESPHSVNATTQTAVSFLAAGLASFNMPSLQVELQLPRMQTSGSFECDGITDIILRYGMPPTGNQQLLTISCGMDYTYDAGSKTYAGTVTAHMGDGLSEPSDAMTADVKARFSFVE